MSPAPYSWLPDAGRCLVRLDLTDNMLTEEAAPALAQALRDHPGLRALNLNDTGLGDEGVAVIAEVRNTPSAGSGGDVVSLMDPACAQPLCRRPR